MTPLEALSSPRQPCEFHVPFDSQDTRVKEATEPYLQRMQENLHRGWAATVTGFRASFEKISFVFFRILEWIYPSLGPRVENIFLRISNIVNSIRDAWKQEEARREMEVLREQNRDLRARAQLFASASEQNEKLKLSIQQLQRENERLSQAQQFLNQEKAAFERRIQGLVSQKDDILARERVVVRDRDLLLRRNIELQKQNEMLIAQCGVGKQNANKEFQEKGNLLEKQVADLRAQMQWNKKIEQALDLIAKACDRVRPDGQKTELDDHLESLLPLLLNQMEVARANLQLVKGNLPLRSSIEIPLQSLEDALSEVVKSLRTIPRMFRLHSQWRQPSLLKSSGD